jgi:hypothetical protein
MKNASGSIRRPIPAGAVAGHGEIRKEMSVESGRLRTGMK